MGKVFSAIIFWLIFTTAVAEEMESNLEMKKAILLSGLGQPQEAYKILLKLSGEGLTRAQVQLGLAFFKGLGIKKNARKSRLWIERAARLGDKNGQYYLAEFYLNGIGIKKDPYSALIWFYRAANNGNLTSFRKIGEMHSKGIATAKNVEEAQMWFELYKLNKGKDAERYLKENGKKLTAAQIKKAKTKARNWSRR